MPYVDRGLALPPRRRRFWTWSSQTLSWHRDHGKTDTARAVRLIARVSLDRCLVDLYVMITGLESLLRFGIIGNYIDLLVAFPECLW